MIEPNEVRRLGTELAKVHARYTTADLGKVLYFAYANRIKGGALPGLAKLLKEFATEIQTPHTHRHYRPRQTAPASRNGNN
ncbi:MAG: hypothetical protein H0X40_15270 [Chthoniobacterales bacterium]|nr:hypothetical protein [Chthoniobacterales bacterium]